MKVEAWFFGGGAPIFAVFGAVYGAVTSWDEPVGVACLFLTAGLALLIGGYLAYVAKVIDARPEDDPFGEISQGAGELGEFAPYSWAPLFAAAGTAVLFAGMAVGVWLMLIGAALSTLGLLAWVFEYYRGEHAH